MLLEYTKQEGIVVKQIGRSSGSYSSKQHLREQSYLDESTLQYTQEKYREK